MRFDLHDGFFLSAVQQGDQAAYLEHFKDKETTDRLLKVPFPYRQEDADYWVHFCLDSASRHLRPHHFALRRGDGFLIGGIGLQLNSVTSLHRAELGFWLAKDYRNRGLTTAAVRGVVRSGFQDFGLNRVEATAATHNLASQRVLEKAGFSREGLLTAYQIKEDVLIDVYMFAIINR